MLTLITPTCDRPQAFSLCERWIARQKPAGPLHWIVIDDGREPAECTRGQDYIRREPGEHPHHSFLNNLLAGFQRALSFGASRICVLEDDDWYHPGYLSQMSLWLNEFDLCGQGRARYYNLHTRYYRELGNREHCSLCQTGFRGDLLPDVIDWIESGQATRMLDTQIWQRYADGRRAFIDVGGSTLSCGIKGLPGKGGLGYGHRMTGRRADHDGSVLRQWVGEDDAAVYLQLMEQQPV